MTRILVTGAGGFIGSGLVPRLIADGHQVRAAVRRPTNLPVETVTVGDIGPATDWEPTLDGIEIVVHLAARVHVLREAARDPLAAFRECNVDGTKRLAAAAERAGARRLILMSSIKAATPDTAYGVSKQEGEAALRATARRMETVILRPPLVYGPGVGANFRALLGLIDSGLPLPFGAVRNRRSLIARDNLVDATVTAMTAPGAAGGIFSVTDGPPLSTPSLIRALAAALNRPARLFPFPVSLMTAAARLLGRADTAESLLSSLEADDADFRTRAGWTPPVAQADAFRAVADWYKTAETRK